MTNSLTCSSSAAIAYDYFVGKGLKDFQAAAIVGNLQQESTFDPAIVGDRGSAHGIAQWHGDRWTAMQQFAAAQGRNPNELQAQLEFIWHELETVPGAGLFQLRMSTTIEDAVRAFQNKFEICGDCNEPARISFAKSALLSCPKIVVPSRDPARIPTTKSGIALAATGTVAAMVAAGYGAYQLLHVAKKFSKRTR